MQLLSIFSRNVALNSLIWSIIYADNLILPLNCIQEGRYEVCPDQYATVDGARLHLAFREETRQLFEGKENDCWDGEKLTVHTLSASMICCDSNTQHSPDHLYSYLLSVTVNSFCSHTLTLCHNFYCSGHDIISEIDFLQVAMKPEDDQNHNNDHNINSDDPFNKMDYPNTEFRLESLNRVKAMFYHGWDSYMEYAFPQVKQSILNILF